MAKTKQPSTEISTTSFEEASSMTNSHKTQVIPGVVETLINLNLIKDSAKEQLNDYIASPFDISTPLEKVKKRPDGFDYVESSYMDYQTKQFMPLYEYKLLHVSYEHGWINILVSLTDRITGNVELGADSARIQVRQGTEAPNFRDILDMGNNLKSALSKAIKNAQSRFGIAADIYQKRESVPTEDERNRFERMAKEIFNISPSRAQMFKEQWVSLGTDWSDFLDKWQVYIERNSKINSDPAPSINTSPNTAGGSANPLDEKLNASSKKETADNNTSIRHQKNPIIL